MGNTSSTGPAIATSTVTVNQVLARTFELSVSPVVYNMLGSSYRANLANLRLVFNLDNITVTSTSDKTTLIAGPLDQSQVGFPTGKLGLPDRDQGYALDSLRVSGDNLGQVVCGSAAILVNNTGSVRPTVTVYYPTVVFYNRQNEVVYTNYFEPVTVNL